MHNVRVERLCLYVIHHKYHFKSTSTLNVQHEHQHQHLNMGQHKHQQQQFWFTSSKYYARDNNDWFWKELQQSHSLSVQSLCTDNIQATARVLCKAWIIEQLSENVWGQWLLHVMQIESWELHEIEMSLAWANVCFLLNCQLYAYIISLVAVARSFRIFKHVNAWFKTSG